MTTLEDQQNARFAALDPLLPRMGRLPAGELLTAGAGAAGVLTKTVHPPGSWQSLWGPGEVWELLPVPGDAAAAGLATLLDVWRERMRRETPAPDSARVLTWPSRDAEVTRVLLDDGFVPWISLAVRANEPVADPGADGVTVRQATEGDLEEVVELRLEELRFSALVGTSVVRPEARELLTQEVLRSSRFGGRIWIAEVDGVAAGVACCGSPGPSQGGGRLPDGLWGYVGTLSVAPAARRLGIGRALMAIAHRELNGVDVRGTFLFYNPANPLSTVFWHRQGYRPLWTTWGSSPVWGRRRGRS
ncbi:GNAT family N-acetyltransferase [Amycolatopsis sp. H20-H5]|uniref:GNAT family N-acetyltransferase n=1 Tax=Amycolatopsis sp. H20-H5 TaxID=3046309 RepID=UPI002DBDE0BA|nr:GNAT family N-acetyltransferase [Amycolatopsis sp. H20-H5]MEC3974153.1 GNAT family N-acetyltransferase [Amycolatopsis sp. H20-H5]